MSEKIHVMIDEETVEKKVREMAAQISREYEGKTLHLICILKGSVFFACELAKRITVPVTLDFMSASSYGDGTQSCGRVKIVKDLDESLEGRDVLVVEDIICFRFCSCAVRPACGCVRCWINRREESAR